MFNLVQGPFGPVFGQVNSGAAAPVQTAPTITTTSLPAATVGVAYSAQLAATGNPSSFTWLLTSGNKPSWLTVSTGGALSGTPQAGDVTTGLNLTFSCSNGVSPNANSGNLSLVVGAASSFAAPVNLLPPTIETVLAGAAINQVGTMLRVKRGGWPDKDGWTLDWRDPNAAYANPGINITNGSIANPVKFSLARRYQWLRNGVPIPEQNGIVYTLNSADIGQTISVRETVNRIVPNAGNTAFVESTTRVSVNSTQTITSISGTQAAALVYKNNLTYLGSFRVHNSYFDVPSIINQDNAQAIAFDKDGDSGNGSLFIYSGSSKRTCEVKIPSSFANGFSTSFDSLPEADILQSARDVTDGWLGSLNNPLPVGAFPYAITGQLIYNNNLIQSAGNLYSTDSNPALSHAKRSKTIATVGGVVSSKVTPSGGYGNPRYLSGPMCHIPAAWQTQLGGKVLTGWAGESINSNANFGPPAYAFDPDLIGSGNLTAQTLLYNSLSLPPDSEGNTKGAQAPIWTTTSFGYGAYGMTIPFGTNSLLYFGMHPTGLEGYNDTVGYENDNIDAFYGGGSRNSFDPIQQTRGPFSGTYAIQCWAYDLNTLAAVKAGSILPYNARPYAVWSMSLPYVSLSSSNSESVVGPTPVLGAVYDSLKKYIYVASRSGMSIVFSAFSVSNAV